MQKHLPDRWVVQRDARNKNQPNPSRPHHPGPLQGALLLRRTQPPKSRAEQSAGVVPQLQPIRRQANYIGTASMVIAGGCMDRP